jgi:hypothetical protein
MGATESWVFLKGRQLMLHVENDGPRALRRGLEASDTPVTLEELQQYPQLYKGALELLTRCENCGDQVKGAEPRERDAV